MVTLEIDGKKVQVEEGTTMFKAAQKAGIEIPYFCYHKDMEPYGGCRLCMVEVTENDVTRLQPSCAYPAKDNTVVKTNTERLIKGRQMIAELLLARCPNIDSVKNLAASLGVTKTRYPEEDGNCVLCGQCVRVCRNVVKAGAIDFIGRGKNRYPGTPFDMPSDDCVGCGSCAYVCPTGAMNMEYENVLRWRKLPGPLRKCRYMRMGFISHKICPNDYQCWNCEVDQMMEDQALTHPVFMLKQSRAKEREMIGQFEMPFDRFYDEGHVWVKRMNGTVRMGVDDFTRQIIGVVNDIKLPPVNTVLGQGDPLWVISGNEKTLHMYTHMEGKIVDINPDIIDNPSLISMVPYGRGWILSFEPKDILEGTKALLSGRSAMEWLKNESEMFNEFIHKGLKTPLSLDKPIPNDFARIIGKNLWSKIDKAFFMGKMKKKIRLHGIKDIFAPSE